MFVAIYMIYSILQQQRKTWWKTKGTVVPYTQSMPNISYGIISIDI